ncbi:MAG: hypothetical protein FWG07_09275 [Treponema sp.]|nr:hypothetical protein [Treponema sp.]
MNKTKVRKPNKKLTSEDIQDKFDEIARLQEQNAWEMKYLSQKMGYLNNRFGELAEHLVAPNIQEKFRVFGFAFDQMSQNHEITDAEANLVAEIDILLENGDTVMVVEVKAKPLQKDIDNHVKRMEILRRRADLKNDKRKYQGAIAGAIMSKPVRDAIHKTGFYAIEQTGDTVKINVPEGFRPREW